MALSSETPDNSPEPDTMGKRRYPEPTIDEAGYVVDQPCRKRYPRASPDNQCLSAGEPGELGEWPSIPAHIRTVERCPSMSEWAIRMLLGR